MISAIQKQINIYRHQQEVQRAYQRVFSTDDGKIIADHLVKNFCLNCSFEDSAAKAAWREGRRAMVLQTLGIAYGPDKFSELLREALIEQQQEE